jgi:hypothetical protein
MLWFNDSCRVYSEEHDRHPRHQRPLAPSPYPHLIYTNPRRFAHLPPDDELQRSAHDELPRRIIVQSRLPNHTELGDLASHIFSSDSR